MIKRWVNTSPLPVVLITAVGLLTGFVGYTVHSWRDDPAQTLATLMLVVFWGIVSEARDQGWLRR